MTRKQKIGYWEKLLVKQSRSGMSLKKFCGKNQLNYKTALHYRHCIRAMNEPESLETNLQIPTFMEIPPDKSQNSGGGIKLEFGNGIRMEFPCRFDQDIFWQIMSLLREAKSC